MESPLRSTGENVRGNRQRAKNNRRTTSKLSERLVPEDRKRRTRQGDIFTLLFFFFVFTTTTTSVETQSRARERVPTERRNFKPSGWTFVCQFRVRGFARARRDCFVHAARRFQRRVETVRRFRPETKFARFLREKLRLLFTRHQRRRRKKNFRK